MCNVIRGDRMLLLKLDKLISGSRSTRYAKIKKYKELGVLEGSDRDLAINYFSPYTWRILYKDLDLDWIVLRALSISGGVITSMRVVGLTVPNPYSDAPIYEVYVPRDSADVFSALIGLRDDVLVISRSRTLFKTPISKAKILVYGLDNSVDFVEVETHYGFKVGEATIEQALIDVVRNDYWYYRGIAFEVYHYARKYVSPSKLLEIARHANIEKRLFTVDYIVSEALGEKSLFNIPEDLELERVNLFEVIERLGDVLD
jgi:hypothetical protein